MPVGPRSGELPETSMLMPATLTTELDDGHRSHTGPSYCTRVGEVVVTSLDLKAFHSTERRRRVLVPFGLGQQNRKVIHPVDGK
jgi:hypothetical protein